MKIHGNYLVQAIGLSALMLTASACSKTEAPAGGMNSANIVDEIGQATALVCPGSAGCEKASGALYVGAAAVSITPAIETWEDTNGNFAPDPGEARKVFSFAMAVEDFGHHQGFVIFDLNHLGKTHY